jgi:hypothetical protein
MRQWRWVGHTLRKGDDSTEKQELEWNPQAARWRGRPKQTWKRTVLEEARKCGKTWSEVKRLAGKQIEMLHKRHMFLMERNNILLYYY